MRLLIDSCTFLWLVDESNRMSRPAMDAFLDPANDRFLSTATIWEISIKYSLGKLPLPAKPERLIPDLRERSGIEALDVDEGAALMVSRLPWLHRDPFDRLLIAQALVHNLTIVTPDEAIEQYGVRTLW